MQLGVSSFAFGWAVATPPAPGGKPFDEHALLDFAIAQGVPVIQFGDNLPLHTFTPARLDTLAARARAASIVIETGTRGLTASQLERYVDLSRRLDARLLRCVIDAPGQEPAAADVIALLREALPALRAAGVVLGLENHDRFSCATLRQIVDRLDSDHVGICLDTANSLGAGEGIHEVLTHLAPVCVNLHVKDFAIERLPYLMGFTISGRSLGAGRLPLDTVLGEVARHGRCGTAVVELWTPPDADTASTVGKELRWAQESVATLRAALLRLASSNPTRVIPSRRPSSFP